MRPFFCSHPSYQMVFRCTVPYESADVLVKICHPVNASTNTSGWTNVPSAYNVSSIYNVSSTYNTSNISHTAYNVSRDATDALLVYNNTLVPSPSSCGMCNDSANTGLAYRFPTPSSSKESTGGSTGEPVGEPIGEPTGESPAVVTAPSSSSSFASPWLRGTPPHRVADPDVAAIVVGSVSGGVLVLLMLGCAMCKLFRRGSNVVRPCDVKLKHKRKDCRCLCFRGSCCTIGAGANTSDVVEQSASSSTLETRREEPRRTAEAANDDASASGVEQSASSSTLETRREEPRTTGVQDDSP